MTEAERGGAPFNILEVVADERHRQVALVLGPVRICVAD